MASRSSTASSVNHVSPPLFDYDEAFSRNLGWVTDWEQQVLRSKKVAIAGMGGVGGVHMLTLARMGFSRFHVSDMDSFELANFNRQIGAMMSTVGQPKASVLERMAQDINPEAEVTVFGTGIHSIDKPGQPANLDEFLDGVDVMIDGFDFFVLDVRVDAYRRCREKGIPVICAAPIGMGTGYLVFTPDSMPFEEYFGFSTFSPDMVARLREGDPQMIRMQNRRYVNFILGLTPSMMQKRYGVDPSRVDLPGKRGPSTAMSCQQCAGVAGVQAVKLMLGRGTVRTTPWYHHFDPYLNKLVVKRLHGGHRHPFQTLKRHVGYRFFDRLSGEARPKEPAPESLSGPMERVLDDARWAPSGDNGQPWSFQVTGPRSLIVHLHHKAGDNVYEYADGEPTWLAAGCLLETMRLAGAKEGWDMQWSLADDTLDKARLEVRFEPRTPEETNGLERYIRVRSVDRTAFKRTPLTEAQKAALSVCFEGVCAVRWYESPGDKADVVKLNGIGTRIRLSIREAFEVHRKVLDFKSAFSRTGLPAGAIGLDPLTVRLMGFLMKGWGRMAFMIRTLGGSYWARYWMDQRPGYNCAAHFSLSWGAIRSSDAIMPQQLIEAGMRLQRFWLTAEAMGLKMQPSLAPLCFARHHRNETPFSQDRWALAKAADLAVRVDDILGSDCFFLGRVGFPRSREAGPRSIRKALKEIGYNPSGGPQVSEG